MTRFLKTILLFAGAFSMLFVLSSCESEKPEPTVNRVVKHPIKPEEIPFDPAAKWQSPSTPPVREDRDLFPEPYPDLNSIIDDAPSWDGGHSIWLPVSSTPSSEDKVQPVQQADAKPAPRNGPYVVLLGTYTQKDRAEDGMSRFQDQGLSVFIRPITYRKQRFFGICYGGYPNFREAKQAGKALVKQGRADEFYVKKLPESP